MIKVSRRWSALENPNRLQLRLFVLLAVIGLLLASCQMVPGLTLTEEEAQASTVGAGAGLDPHEACGVAPQYQEPIAQDEDYRIVTLLPRDRIPAIDNPRFLSAAEAAGEYDPDEMVLGVEFNGQARAYSVSFLSSHEIVNDDVGGCKIAVTW